MAKYAAQPFVAGTPQALVLGQTVKAFSSNLLTEQIAHLLPKHGLDNIDPEKWYPHQNWMNLLKELSEAENSDSNLVAFGKEVVRTAAMPPELDSIPKVLHALHAIHHINLRNIPEDEGYSLEEVGERHYYVYHNTPNPDTAIYGFLWGLCARFKQPDEIFYVSQISNSKPDENPGTVFEVKWGPSDAAL